MRSLVLTLAFLLAGLALADAPTLTITTNPLTVTRVVGHTTYTYHPCQDNSFLDNPSTPDTPTYQLTHFFGPGGTFADDGILVFPQAGLTWMLTYNTFLYKATFRYMPVAILQPYSVRGIRMTPYAGTLPTWLDTQADLVAFTKAIKQRSDHVTRSLGADNSVTVTAANVGPSDHTNAPLTVIAHFPPDRAKPATYIEFTCSF